MPDGRIGFTRNGAFGRNAEGLLTTASGYVVQPEIAIPEGVTEINVSADGLVSVQVAGEAEAAEVGQLTLANFANPAGLQPIGENFTVETPASGAPAIGNPFGLGGTVTSGIISARNRSIGLSRYEDYIQTDASINQGNSGGPLFDMNGNVIGINTAILGRNGSIGIGFSIPSNSAKIVIDQLIEFGETKRGWLGVSCLLYTSPSPRD